LFSSFSLHYFFPASASSTFFSLSCLADRGANDEDSEEEEEEEE
jgi:hypothetical protein